MNISGADTGDLRTAQAREIEEVAAPDRQVTSTLAHAFRDDPGLSYVLPDAGTRARALPRFFAVAAGQSHDHGQVLASKTRHAAALIYPPGVIKDDGLWVSLRFLAIFKTALPRGLKVAEAMHAHHPDPQPYTYLRYVGVAPEAQGQGWGGAMVREVIRRAADQGQGVLLETATPSNVAIYARLGFEISEEWQVPGGGPPFWTMIHPAP